MGLFDSIKKALGLDSPAGNNFANQSQGNFHQQNNFQQQRPHPGPQFFPSQNLAADVMNILQTEFAGYEISTNFDVRHMVAEAQFGGPVDFGISQNGKLVAVIMLIEQGKFRTKRVWGVEKSCAHLGIPMLRLYRHFGFNRPKVVQYIAKNLPR